MFCWIIDWFTILAEASISASCIACLTSLRMSFFILLYRKCERDYLSLFIVFSAMNSQFLFCQVESSRLSERFLLALSSKNRFCLCSIYVSTSNSYSKKVLRLIKPWFCMWVLRCQFCIQILRDSQLVSLCSDRSKFFLTSCKYCNAWLFFLAILS